MVRRLAFLAAPLLLAACTRTPPPHWAEGGAALELPTARWTAGDEVVTIRPDGTVLHDGQFEVTLDRAGRLYDEDNEPIAVLEADGHLVATNDVELGRVGSMTASPPGASYAWLAVSETGEVTRFGPDGERSHDGAWVGCNATPQSALACTLVTHLLALRAQAAARASPGVSVGVGIGFGVGVGVGR